VKLAREVKLLEEIFNVKVLPHMSTCRTGLVNGAAAQTAKDGHL
jgi:hypothetical protein